VWHDELSNSPSDPATSAFEGADNDPYQWQTQAKFVKSGAVAVVQLAVEKPICVELFSDVPQLGRFTLRDEGRTIAVGKIVKLPKAV